MRIVRHLLLAAAIAPLSTAVAGAADVIPFGNVGGLMLGAHWGTYETYKGVSFRWIDNDAQIILRGSAGLARLTIACAGGPSLRQAEFPLRVLDLQHRQVDHAMCEGSSQPQTLVFPIGPGASTFLLHVDGGGHILPNEPRILNAQIFMLDDQRGGKAVADVVDARSGIRFADHWYEPEQFHGETFRWMEGNRGEIVVSSDRRARAALRLVLEVGPSVGSRSTSVAVLRTDGTALVRTTLVGRSTVVVPVTLKVGDNAFSVTVTSKNRPVPHDKRILNVRVLGAAIQ